MSVLLLKLFLAPLLVVTCTLAGRRWGPEVAGILVGLPIVAGPILFISYLQHGADFAGDAAGAALLGLVSLAVFAVVFSRAARRFHWAVTLAAGWTAVVAVDAALSAVHVAALVATAFTLVATGVALAIGRAAPEPGGGPTRAPWWDLPGRAAATGALVVAVTTASGVLGPHWTGLFSPFPIAISVVAAFVHAQQGAAATARTLTGALVGLIAFSTFCLAVAVLVRPVGAAAFALAAAVAVAVQLLVTRTRRALRERRTRSTDVRAVPEHQPTHGGVHVAGFAQATGDPGQPVVDADGGEPFRHTDYPQ